jgi:tRNA 2-thiouridine synthesizing protein E
MSKGASQSKPELLSDGRLADLDKWSEDVATQLAAKDGIKLGDDHWQVINAMRDYYREFNVSPVKKLLKRSLKERSKSERFDDKLLDSLFPHGVLAQGSKIAGVPLPYLDVELERSTFRSKPASAEASHFTDSFEFEGKKYPVTQTGNLIDLHLWNEKLAEFMADKEGITLTDAHWEILNFLRKFYFEYGIAPMVKILQKHLAHELGPEQASRQHLYGLFPGGPSRQGSRIAGLPEPQGCIDG